MRNFIFALLLVFGLSSCGHYEHLKREKTVLVMKKEVPFEKIFEIPNMKKSDLYTACNLWFISYFRDFESNIEYSDETKGIISGRFVIGSSFHVCKQSIIIKIKDNRVKVFIKNPAWKTGILYGHPPIKMGLAIFYEEPYAAAREKWEIVVKSMKEYLLKYDKSDW